MGFLYMTAFRIQTTARGFARQIILSGVPRQIVRAVVWAALIASASDAAAQQPDTGASMFRGCKAFVGGGMTDAQMQSLGAFCAGFVLGLATVGKDLSPPEWRSCPPATFNAQQSAQLVVSFIEAHPQRMNEDFRRLTLEAFHQAWPCSN